jgi:hypothetical protein
MSRKRNPTAIFHLNQESATYTPTFVFLAQGKAVPKFQALVWRRTRG